MDRLETEKNRNILKEFRSKLEDYFKEEKKCWDDEDIPEFVPSNKLKEIKSEIDRLVPKLHTVMDKVKQSYTMRNDRGDSIQIFLNLSRMHDFELDEADYFTLIDQAIGRYNNLLTKLNLGEKRLNILGPILSILPESGSLTDIQKIIRKGGISISLPYEEKIIARFGSRREFLMSMIQLNYNKLSSTDQSRFLKIVAEEISKISPEYEQKIKKSIEQIGWRFINGELVQVEVLDESELANLPEISHPDLIKAAKRIDAGDLSGAIGAACGSVDSMTKEIYQRYGLGDLEKASFQEKVNISLKTVLKPLEKELIKLGWKKEDAKQFYKSLLSALNQSAFVMQSLRSKMGDVHGTKLTLKPLVFDSINWAKIILSLLGIK